MLFVRSSRACGKVLHCATGRALSGHFFFFLSAVVDVFKRVSSAISVKLFDPFPSCDSGTSVPAHLASRKVLSQTVKTG